ncbi:sensor histidine kinase, partial [Enterocloster asparagiformis]
PHFIYNTLSSIRTLIKLDPDRAYNLVYDFSKYLRANIDSIGQGGMIPFAQELEHIRNYCNIEKVRFGDKLALVYEIGPDGFEVPPLTVQPLVENAIKHGIRGKNGDGTVKVSTLEDEHSYMVEVLDDGAGFDPAAGVPKTSAGLENIRLRLQEIAGACLEINSIPGKGTRAIVRIPKQG